MHSMTARRQRVAGVIALAWIGASIAATPTEMKAIVQTGNGGPEVLRYETVPVREPAAGQVLIRVYAAAVNPVDWKMRNGMGRPPSGAGGPPGGAPRGEGAGGPPPGGAPGGGPGGPGGSPPAAGPARSIPGMDVAGVVERVGADVTSVKVGDPVFSMLGRVITGMNGGYAQFALAPAANVVPKPKNLSHAEAAGLGTTGMTGFRTVSTTNVSKGQRVLVTGAAGGVGSAAVQVAKSRGAYVIGTASARHNDYLRSIGIDEVVDYTKVKFEEQVKDVDVVIDTVGADTAERALQTLKRGGTFASVAGRIAAEKCTAAGVTCAGGGPPGQGGMSEGAVLAEVGKLAGAGKLGVHIDARYPLEKAADAQVQSATGRTQGKIILIVDAAKADQR